MGFSLHVIVLLSNKDNTSINNDKTKIKTNSGGVRIYYVPSTMPEVPQALFFCPPNNPVRY